MKDLIEALQILIAYGDVAYPTNCSHDTLHIFPAVENSAIAEAHLERLDELGFHQDSEQGGFYSFKYGSC